MTRTNVIPLFAPEPTAEERVARRGYSVTYRGSGQDWCPGCGRRHWYVGRMYAECAFCGTAVPLNLGGSYEQ